ncbi:MAG: hypothetical protein JXQ66_01180 [Campylobacterales bacterium]|nr:hypothetical protein [Campylobacterales bacterium]
MRNALTLIELIFSMVIIAVVFSVIPKIIFASNKSLQLSVKEDGVYNAISLMGSIVKLPWDENTIQSRGEILHTSQNDCNSSTGYRVGGFIGSRNCKDSDLNTSLVMGQEGSYLNDIDDYNGYSDFNETSASGKDYNLSVAVGVDASDPNIKEINVSVEGGAKTGDFKSTFFYESANLGHIMINKRAW